MEHLDSFALLIKNNSTFLDTANMNDFLDVTVAIYTIDNFKYIAVCEELNLYAIADTASSCVHRMKKIINFYVDTSSEFGVDGNNTITTNSFSKEQTKLSSDKSSNIISAKLFN